MSEPRKPFEALEEYQSGGMPDADAAGFEEELFAAAAAGTAEEASFVDRVALIGRYLEPRGGLDIGSTRARVDQLLGSGLRVQLIEPAPAPSVQMPPLDPDAEIVITHVAVDVRGYDSVDVVVETPDGTELKTFRDVGWDPDDGTMYAVCEGHLARLAAQVPRVVSRIIGTRAGQKHQIAVFESVNSS
ncbi:MAG TPA: hypothetical protein VHB79_11795 [Polyangiaceae bacterium]|nr:hypothetical protein [Polyangiaceae bacterium]